MKNDKEDEPIHVGQQQQQHVMNVCVDHVAKKKRKKSATLVKYHNQ